MRKFWIGFAVILTFGGLLAAVFLLLVRYKPKPPAGEMEYAREMLSDAGATRADAYSRKVYSQAQAFYDSAMANWQRENDKFILFRDYDKVAMFAEMSARKAREATDVSRSISASLCVKLREKIDSLNNL